MKRLLLLLLLVMAVVAAPLRAARAQAAPVAELSAVVAGVPISADTEIALIDQAARLLQEKFFEPVNTEVLYQGAVGSANKELQTQGVASRLASVTFTGEPTRDWGLFYDAYLAAADKPGIDQKALAYATISGMADALKDCHTYFMQPEAYQRLQQSLRGEQKAQGVGIVTRAGTDGYPIVEEVYRGAPAYTAGMKSGDKLLTLNGEDLKGTTLAQLAAKIRERVGQEIQFTVARPGSPNPVPISVTPAQYTVPVYDIRMLEDGVGYVRLYNFAQTLNKEKFQEFYRDLRAQGATKIVWDLRNNPGGSAAAAVALLSTMIPSGQPLFSFIARDGSVSTAKSVDNLFPEKVETAILINRNTASAGEIVAAVAQDFGVARVFGVKTEGCVASVGFHKLADGSALGITSTRVDTAKGRNLNRIGVAPDVSIDRTVEDLGRGFDPQLISATNYLTGRPETPVMAAPAASAPNAPSIATSPQPTTEVPRTAAGPTAPSSNAAFAAVPAGTPVQRGWALLTLEEPAPNATLTGRVQLGGWAINTASGGQPISEVTVTVEPNGQAAQAVTLGTATYGLDRPDVAAALGPTYLKSGYTFAFDASTLPPGQHQLTVRVRAGADVESYTVPITVQPTSIANPALGVPLG